MDKPSLNTVKKATRSGDSTSGGPRDVVMRQGLYMQLDALALSLVRAWAAQGRLRPGFAVFKSTNVFDESVCSECPRGLVCKEFIES